MNLGRFLWSIIVVVGKGMGRMCPNRSNCIQSTTVHVFSQTLWKRIEHLQKDYFLSTANNQAGEQKDQVQSRSSDSKYLWSGAWCVCLFIAIFFSGILYRCCLIYSDQEMPHSFMWSLLIFRYTFDEYFFSLIFPPILVSTWEKTWIYASYS